MPKFIGNRIEGATHLPQFNASTPRGHVRLSYSQAALLPPDYVVCSLDTTDRGGRGSYAKRWYRWFASADHILACERSTKLMRLRAARASVPHELIAGQPLPKSEP